MRKSIGGWIVCCQLFVIVPGRQIENVFPAWPIAMAKAINTTLASPAAETKIENSVVDLTGKVNANAADNFILFDWSSRSRDISVADDSDVAGLLATIMIKRCSDLYQKTRKPVNVHIIGHSRGCYLICAALRRWQGYQGIGFVQMTTLDPQSEGRDGKLESNPGGMVDWAHNYYQTLAFPKGRQIDGALNVGLNTALRTWDAGKDYGRHSQVHSWYEGIWKSTRPEGHARLYGANPLVEYFNGDNAPYLFFSQGRGSQTKRVPTPLLREGTKINLIANRQLQMLPEEKWLVSTVFCRTTTAAKKIAAEFTLRLAANRSSMPADGITFVIADANQKTDSLMGRVGGELGYAGLNGVAVAFDNYFNSEYKDPLDPGTKISLRINGMPDWVSLPDAFLPESLSVGNPWRARLTLDSSKREISWLVYSFGADKSIAGKSKLPANAKIPHEKAIGFTAASGNGAQRHIIDDVIIVPLND